MYSLNDGEFFEYISSIDSNITNIIGFDWKESKNGYLTAIILIRPINIDNVIISRFYGGSAKMILDQKLGRYAMIMIHLYNTIPFVEVIKGSDNIIWPDYDFYWNEKNTEILAKK